jgi:hypothetical protein
MAKKNQKKYSNAANDINYYETLGSAVVNPDDANAVLDKSSDAVRQNIQTKKAHPDQIVP